MCQQVNKVCLLYLKACKQKLGPGQTHKYLATVTQCSEIPRADCLNTAQTFFNAFEDHVSTIHLRNTWKMFLIT